MSDQPETLSAGEQAARAVEALTDEQVYEFLSAGLKDQEHGWRLDPDETRAALAALLRATK